MAKLYGYWIKVNYYEAYGLYACNGILFNHESPLRGGTFVTRKITRALARIELGLQDCLYFGTMDSLRDWGHARVVVKVDPRYFRPTEVETLLGGRSKAKQKMGWAPKITFPELIAEMVREDLKGAECDELLKKHGYAAYDFHDVMAINLYGPGDNYHPEKSHVIPALIRKLHEAKIKGESSVTVWGSDTPRREFLFSDDMASACVFLMNLDAARFDALLGSDESVAGKYEPPLMNTGCGEDLTIRDLAGTIGDVVGYLGEIRFDTSRPDGPPRKLLAVEHLHSAAWARTVFLENDLRIAYSEFVKSSH